MSRWQRAWQAALEVNGFGNAPDPSLVTTQPEVSPAKPVTKRAKAALPVGTPDRVIVFGPAGILLRVKDGRLPRETDVELDGACLRLTVRGRAVLVACCLRAAPASDKLRWATASELVSADRNTIAVALPGQLAELTARERIDLATREVAAVVGVGQDGDAESRLRAVLYALRSNADAGLT